MRRLAWSVPVVAVALGLLVATGPASAQSGDRFRLETAGDLLRVCTPDEGDRMRSDLLHFCQGFMLGNGQLYEQLVRAGSIKRPWACAEPIPRLAEIREAFITWAKAHPERHKERAIDGFWQAMSGRWPCR